ncbi:MAG: chorismate synthase [Clostridiaceae bacterium]|nr:chorismate synthase [Clostridiaceae bacterium]
MSSIWGRNLKVSLFGESHGPAIGVVIDGLPAGFALDAQAINAYMQRRAPGRTPWSTSRKEADDVELLSGFFEGRTTGTPLAAMIRNTDTHSEDYRELRAKPRPGHADLTAEVRYHGYQDPRGGGHFSGRLTAPLTFAGAACSQIIRQKGIRVAAHALEIAGIADLPFDAVQPDLTLLEQLAAKKMPVLDDEQGCRMAEAVERARQAGDSVGGVVETLIWGLPAGLGDPIFDGLESRLASLIFGIPAVKGLEFGAGFAAARMTGSEHNDIPLLQGQAIRFRSNHSGGIQGGISNGMPVVFRTAFKPTASIGREQETINLEQMAADRLLIHGRHDPCIVPRAVPVVEAAAAVFALDLLLDSGFGR